MKKIILLLCLFSAFTTSCRKLSIYPDDLDPTVGTTSKLIVGTWKLTGSWMKVVTSDGKITEFNNLPSYQPCDFDDVITYSSNQVYVLDYGSDLCEPLDPSSMTGSWTVSKDNKFLTITFPPNDYINDLVSEIISVTSTTLTTRTTLGIGDADFTNTLIFTKVK